MPDKTEPVNETTKIPSLNHNVPRDSQMARDLHKFRKIMLLTLLPSASGLPPLGGSRRRRSSCGHNNTPPSAKINEEGQEENTAEPITTPTNTKRKKSIKISEQSKTVESKGNQMAWSDPQPSTSRGYSSVNDKRRHSSTSHFYVRTRTGKSRSRSEIDPPTRSLEESFNGLANFALEQTENSMDLLTLSNIHSEFKSKLFGEEWINREQKSSYEKRQDTDSSEVPRPHRLTPLKIQEQSRRNSIAVHSQFNTKPIPTGGLHLSANYNISMPDGFLESSMPTHRRRKNSLDESTKNSSSLANETSYDRPNSAPDRGKELTVKDPEAEFVSPARANTPTGPVNSARVHKPQLMGLSFATNSPEESLNFSVSSLDRSWTYIRSPTPKVSNPETIPLSKSMGKPPTSRVRLGPISMDARKSYAGITTGTSSDIRPLQKNSSIFSPHPTRKTSLR